AANRVLGTDVADVEISAVEAKRLYRFGDRREAQCRGSRDRVAFKVGRDVELDVLNVNFPIGSVLPSLARRGGVGPCREGLAITTRMLMFRSDDGRPRREDRGNKREQKREAIHQGQTLIGG